MMATVFNNAFAENRTEQLQKATLVTGQNQVKCLKKKDITRCVVYFTRTVYLTQKRQIKYKYRLVPYPS